MLNVKINNCPICHFPARFLVTSEGVSIKCTNWKCGISTPALTDVQGDFWENGKISSIEIVLNIWNGK